jgi:hypothetical protein
MMTPPLQTKRPTFDAIPPTAHHSEDWAQHHRKDFRGAHSHGYVDTMNDQKLQFFTMSVFNKHDVDQSGKRGGREGTKIESFIGFLRIIVLA